MLPKTASTAMIVLVVVAGIGPAAASPAALGSQPAQTASCSFPVTATDATGTDVTVDEEPERVVTLNPSAAQTLWEIGARDKVVGVSKHASYLDGAESRTNISGAGQQFVNVEKVTGLEPDLVLAPNTISNETVETLRGAGLTVFKFGFANSFSDIYSKTNQTGQFVGACDEAESTVSEMRTRVDTIQQAVGNESAPGTIHLLTGSFVSGNGTFIGNVLTTGGAENLAASEGIEGYQKISSEVVASQNVEWIITSDRSTVPDEAPWSETTAVQRNQTLIVNKSHINEAAPRVILPLTKIARSLHPEAIRSANLSATSIGSANRSANATTAQPVAADGGTVTTSAGDSPMSAGDGTTAAATDGSGAADDVTDTAGDATDAATGTAANATTTSSGSGPGFGVTVAIVALLGAALLARRT